MHLDGRRGNGKALRNPFMVAVSPDGSNVYASSLTSGAVAIFDRRAGGAIRQKTGRAGCISRTGTHRACRKARVLDGPIALAMSADGKNLYTAPGFENSISILDRAITRTTVRTSHP